MTFHSIFYEKDSDQYRQGYVLMKNITWKMNEASITKPLYVLFNKTPQGQKEIEKIKEAVKRDKEFKQDLVFCNQCDSRVLGAMQIADMLIGAVSATINERINSEEKYFVANHITKRNDGISLNSFIEDIPKIGEYKIDIFNPTEPSM